MDNRRAYRRSSHFNGHVVASKDGTNWNVVDVADISAGGLRFYSSANYEIGDLLWFHLLLAGYFSEFEVKTMGEVLRKSPYAEKTLYAARFQGISLEKRVQIDENVNNDRPVSGDTYEAD